MRTLLILASLFLFGTQAARTASGSEKIIAQYAREFNKPELFELVTHQIILIFEKTQDPETGPSKHF